MDKKKYTTKPDISISVKHYNKVSRITFDKNNMAISDFVRWPDGCLYLEDFGKYRLASYKVTVKIAKQREKNIFVGRPINGVTIKGGVNHFGLELVSDFNPLDKNAVDGMTYKYHKVWKNDDIEVNLYVHMSIRGTSPYPKIDIPKKKKYKGHLAGSPGRSRGSISDGSYMGVSHPYSGGLVRPK